MIKLEGLYLFCLILKTASAQSQANKNAQFIQQNKFLLGAILFLIMLGIAVYFDKRNGYKYITIIRLKAGQIIIRLRNIRIKKQNNKKQKISTQESIPTSKQMRNIFDSQKTFTDGPMSAHQTIIIQKNNDGLISNMEMQQDTPKVDLRQVFQQKSTPNNKRSKSKIRNRVQIKKSQIQEQDIKDIIQVTDDNSNQTNQNE